MTESVPELTTKNLCIPALPSVAVKIDLATFSQPYFKECQIEALHDIAAVQCWLKNHEDTLNTFMAYERQAKLFLMWCSYECGKTIGQLKVQDFENYFSFLKNPPITWCANRASLRQGKASLSWRPLVKGLSPVAIQMSFRILKSLMGYLVDSEYVRSNPLKLIKLGQQYPHALEEQKYRVWARMLEEDEWQALQTVLNDLPEETPLQIGDKLRIQFLFGLLYFLGLRIHEVANHTWSAFQFREGKWWFFVKGKGGRLGHIPLHEKLLTLAKLYRIYLNKSPLPTFDEQAPLLMTLKQKPMQIRQLYNQVKKIGFLASLGFKDAPLKAAKLRRLSPHWLRHLSASHQDKAGITATMIKENLRHRSVQTTQLYLHTEEDRRHEAMQKMSLAVAPKSGFKKVLQSQTVIEVSLTQGPVHKGLGFKKLLEALEEEVFNPYAWQPYRFEKEKKIKEVETSIIPVQTITFAYVFSDLAEEQNGVLKRAIVVEAGIRLFKTNIAVKKR